MFFNVDGLKAFVETLDANDQKLMETWLVVVIQS